MMIPFVINPLITGLYVVDACIQFWCVRELWNGALRGYRGLMILFVLRVMSLFFILSSLDNNTMLNIFSVIVIGNGFDALLLVIPNHPALLYTRSAVKSGI